MALPAARSRWQSPCPAAWQTARCGGRGWAGYAGGYAYGQAYQANWACQAM